jgi:hypothetical protein
VVVDNHRAPSKTAGGANCFVGGAVIASRFGSLPAQMAVPPEGHFVASMTLMAQGSEGKVAATGASRASLHGGALGAFRLGGRP